MSAMAYPPRWNERVRDAFLARLDRLSRRPPLAWPPLEAAVNRHHDLEHPGTFMNCRKRACRRARGVLGPTHPTYEDDGFADAT